MVYTELTACDWTGRQASCFQILYTENESASEFRIVRRSAMRTSEQDNQSVQRPAGQDVNTELASSSASSYWPVRSAASSSSSEAPPWPSSASPSCHSSSLPEPRPLQCGLHKIKNPTAEIINRSRTQLLWPCSEVMILNSSGAHKQYLTNPRQHGRREPPVHPHHHRKTCLHAEPSASCQEGCTP